MTAEEKRKAASDAILAALKFSYLVGEGRENYVILRLKLAEADRPIVREALRVGGESLRTLAERLP